MTLIKGGGETEKTRHGPQPAVVSSPLPKYVCAAERGDVAAEEYWAQWFGKAK